MPPKKQREKEPTQIVQWTGADEADLIYANSLAITQTPYEFVLTFGQIRPALTHEGEERHSRVTSRAVVRIVVSIARMPDFVAAINQNYSKLAARIEQELGRQKTRPEELGERKQ